LSAGAGAAGGKIAAPSSLAAMSRSVRGHQLRRHNKILVGVKNTTVKSRLTFIR
jgi:hypothetical protein